MTASKSATSNNSHIHKGNRPIFLNLFKIAFPITALVSIGHRVSGFCLFLLIPLSLLALQMSLTEQGFAQVYDLFSQFKALFSLIFLALVYHLLAGIRHLLLDLHIGLELHQARLSAFVVYGLSALAFVFFWFI